MASIAGSAPYEERSLFVRKATGLVRGWSVQDAFIYAFFSINLITLGLYIFASGPFIPKGGLMLAIILSGAYLVFQTIVYAALIAVMPRAGGDYVWVSRVIGGGIGFVLAVCGWWFINWHWVPIYANILVKEFFQPLSAVIGWDRGVSFWGEPRGRSEEHTSELQSHSDLVCRLLLEKKTALHGVRLRRDPRLILRRRDQQAGGGLLFFFNDTATTEIYTLSLHDALPI